MNLSSTGSPLTEYIKQIKNQTIDALGDEWELKKPIELELSTVAKSNDKGNIDIRVISFGADVETEEIQKVKLTVGPKNEINDVSEVAVTKPNFLKKRF